MISIARLPALCRSTDAAGVHEGGDALEVALLEAQVGDRGEAQAWRLREARDGLPARPVLFSGEGDVGEEGGKVRLVCGCLSKRVDINLNNVQNKHTSSR